MCVSPVFARIYLLVFSKVFQTNSRCVKSFSISWDTIVAISQILKHIGLVVKLSSFYSHLQTIFPLMIVGGFIKIMIVFNFRMSQTHLIWKSSKLQIQLAKLKYKNTVHQHNTATLYSNTIQYTIESECVFGALW